MIPQGAYPGGITMDDAVKSVVERARLGDQNALCDIGLVRHYAEMGHEGYKQGLQRILSYASKNPPKAVVLRTNPIGEDGATAINVLRRPDLHPYHQASALFFLPIAYPGDGLFIAGHVLTEGPDLTDQRIGEIVSGFPEEDMRKIFVYGVIHGLHSDIVSSAGPKDLPLLLAGRTVAASRATQMARLPGTPITPLSPAIGWELGE